jgi:replicative DNA helicase Mcm
LDWNTLIRPPKVEALNDQGKKSYYVTWPDILKANGTIEEVLNKGDEYLNHKKPDWQTVEHIRITQLPETHRKELRGLRADDIGKFISVTGIVRSAQHPPKPRFLSVDYKCRRCGHLTREPQGRFKEFEPSQCSHCEKTTTTKYEKTDTGHAIDSQMIILQERPSSVNSASQPSSIIAYLEEDVAGTVNPGEIVTLNGHLKLVDKNKGKKTVDKTTMTYYLDVNSVEHLKSDSISIDITEDDVEEIMRLSDDPLIFDRFVASIAPTIYDMNNVKEGMVLQQFGGVGFTAPDGTWMRGDIHVFIVGEPGVAKSVLLKSQSRLAPKSVFSSGLSASKAGLTAAVIEENGEWVIAAGTMVLSDMGIACIDEFDKMNKDDKAAIHPGMAQQEIPIDKANIHVSLPSRCGVFAAANPKAGVFNQFTDLYEQLDIPLTSLSRFDLVYIVKDVPEPATDRAKMKHLLNTVRGRGKKTVQMADNLYIEPDMMRKYIAYARRIKPVLTDACDELLEDYYATIREKYAKGVGMRQGGGIVRLAEASARVHLREQMSVDDVYRAISVFKSAMNSSGLDEDGNFDAKKYYSGVNRNLSMRRSVVYGIIRDAEEEGISIHALEETCMALEKPIHDWEEILEGFKNETPARIYEPTNGVLKTTRR